MKYSRCQGRNLEKQPYTALPSQGVQPELTAFGCSRFRHPPPSHPARWLHECRNATTTNTSKRQPTSRKRRARPIPRTIFCNPIRVFITRIPKIPVLSQGHGKTLNLLCRCTACMKDQTKLEQFEESAFRKELDLDFFKENGFMRKHCSSCGLPFWTLDPGQALCGDAPCVEYSFIGDPITRKPFDMETMRELFLSFFETNAHTRLSRYPVVARWRPDIYLTIASIADFQPHVTSGQVKPPANPLVISQPCIRLNDLDSVGKTGRHLSSFEMMAHHAFNTRDERVYWKEETVTYCHELLTGGLGVDAASITYKENPWSGGGNAGAALEVLVGGLELATLVFMDMKETPDGDRSIGGTTYSKMDLEIVDTGYGLERFVWATTDAPTIYDAIYPDVVASVLESSSANIDTGDQETRALLGEYARLCAVVDIEESSYAHFRKIIVKRLKQRDFDVDDSIFDSLMEPMEKIYSVADHARTLAFMLGDGVVPSNVKEGYLARLIIRRALRFMEDLEIQIPLFELVHAQIKGMQTFPAIVKNVDIIGRILELETRRYGETVARGRNIVIRKLRESGMKEIPVQMLVELYDSHGLHPSIVERVASEQGIDMVVPDNFSSMIAGLHSTTTRKRKEEAGEYSLPATKLLYYMDEYMKEFDAVVLHATGGKVILNQTGFYPEGGGQPSDLGWLETEDINYIVEKVLKSGDVVVHYISGDTPDLKVGDTVHGRIDWEKRISLMRHHTATHIVLSATRKVLGPHIWQAGARKGVEQSRLDVSHYRRITDEERMRIETLANDKVMENLPVERFEIGRNEAEKKYGFRLYQGGAPRSNVIRVLRIAGYDVQACGGTHVRSTSEVGPIRILRCSSIQDGIERIEFSAGKAAVKKIQEMEALLHGSSAILSVPSSDLPRAVERFFSEWKMQRKEIERLNARIAELEMAPSSGSSEEINGVSLLARVVELDDVRDLMRMVTDFVDEGNALAFLGNRKGQFAGGYSLDIPDRFQQFSHDEFVSIFRESGKLVGGGGGGRGNVLQGGGPVSGKMSDAVELFRKKVADLLGREKEL